MSLSPRPDKVRSTVDPAGISPLAAARSTHATACADSSAHRIPSALASRWTAATTYASFTVT
jgi:hypothetical protein